MAEWFETLDDRLWLRSDDSGDEEAKFIAMCLHLRRGNRVLDAPCGAGRITLPLAKLGYRTVGIDLRASFIARAQRRFEEQGLSGELKAMDLRDMDYFEEFDGICNWFNSFGYFDDQVNEELLYRYYRALRPGGRFLVDQWNRERILRNMKPVKEIGNVVFKSSWHLETQRNIVRRVVDGREDRANRSSQRWYTPSQMQGLLERVGFSVEKTYGSHDGGSFSRASRQMIMLAVKPSGK